MARVESWKVGGAALVLGYLLVLAILFSGGYLGASADPWELFYFLAMPVVGALLGGYAYVDGPYTGMALFVGANYLGVFGVAFFVSFPAPSGVSAVAAAGLLAVGLAVVAGIASLRLGLEYFRAVA